tara:strand:- start:457 stop:699 length:243 start_codon:yes stop_codon:yes gene_type:complete
MSKRQRTQTSFYSPDESRNVRQMTDVDVDCEGWSSKEQALFENDNKAYQKEQERRRLAGQTPVIICMGGPYSDAWYPPLK